MNDNSLVALLLCATHNDLGLIRALNLDSRKRDDENLVTIFPKAAKILNLLLFYT